MKTINLYIIALFAVLMSSCNSNEEKFFNDVPTIYFDLNEAARDSIQISFAKTTAKELVYEIPVIISGYPSDKPRKFNVTVDEQRSTAKVNEHFKPLLNEYIIEPNQFKATIPVTFFCTDEELDTKEVDLIVKITPSADFSNGITDRQECRICMSNILLKPGSWDGWWSRTFGVYSRVKHKIILEQCGIEVIPDSPEGSKRYKWQGYGNVVLNYFKVNYPVYDENNKIIEPNWTIKY